MNEYPEELLQRYTVHEQLGSGNFGQVYLATRRRTGSRRAIKVVAKRGNWRREIEVLTLLRHPNIVRYHDHIEGPAWVYVIMEYCSGGDLLEHVQRCRGIEEVRAKRLAGQLLGALEYCQGHLIAHRDLKLENLLLDADDNLKLADFGLAKQTEGNTDSIVGSIWYIALEMFQGTSYNPMLSDAWSFGVVLCCMVQGGFPFAVSSEKELRKLLWQRQVPPLTHKTLNGKPPSEAFMQLVAQLLVPAADRLPLHRCKHAAWFRGVLVDNGLERREPCDPDPAIVQVIVDMGYAREAVENVVRKNKPCPAHSIYHLLAGRQLQRTDSMPELVPRLHHDTRTHSLSQLAATPHGLVDSPPPVLRKLRRLGKRQPRI